MPQRVCLPLNTSTFLDTRWRIVAIKNGARVRLVSRTGRDHACRFPELTQAIAALSAPTVVLDGEVCRFDEKLVSRFHLLSEPDGLAVARPPVFMAFDCLHLGGRDLRTLHFRIAGKPSRTSWDVVRGDGRR